MEDQDEAALKALGIDPADVANAEASRRAVRSVGSEESDNEEDLENDEDDNVGEEE